MGVVIPSIPVLTLYQPKTGVQDRWNDNTSPEPSKGSALYFFHNDRGENPVLFTLYKIALPTIPARSGVFKCHTFDTYDNRYFGMSDPTVPAPPGIFKTSYLQNPAPFTGISRFQFLPYRLNEVFSNATPTIPTHTPVWHTRVNAGDTVGTVPTFPTDPV